MSNKLLFGVGLNDADYPVSPVINGKQVRCIFYATWANMLNRCYGSKYHKRQPTYIGCSVCDEWLIFSNFKKWMERQDWKGKELDKDIISFGNKIYSPDNCAFVDAATNCFVSVDSKFSGSLPTGVYWNTRDKKFTAQCSNPLTKVREGCGYFDCPEKAHFSWKRRKHEIACILAEMQTDVRVASALRIRYS